MLEGRPQAAIEALYQQREPYYQQADIVVDTTGLGPDQVAMEVIRALRTVHGARA
jgi:shikimate kinase